MQLHFLATNFQLFEPNHANPQIIPIIIIHGVDNNNFSNELKKIIMDQKKLLYHLHIL